MVSRRALLISGLASLPLRLVRASPVRGVELRRGTAVEQLGHGAVTATRLPPAYNEIVRLGGLLRPRSVRVVSRDNANRQFAASFEGAGDAAYLGIDDRWFAWSWSSTNDVGFLLDRDGADRVARAFGVAVELRDRIDDVELAWRLPAVVAVGAPAVAIIRADNHGTQPLRLSGGPEALDLVGGRDGEPIRKRSPGIYNGPQWSQPLPAGGHAELAFSLERLLEIDRPGRYVASITYRGQLTRGLDMPVRFDAARWDLDVGGQLAVVAA